jgi:hypothetical protein
MTRLQQIRQSLLRRFLCRRLPVSVLLGALLLGSSNAPAIILFSTGDSSFNTTEPGGSLAGSGWQYEGRFGAFVGTAIGLHHFISVKHIGIPSNVFVYQGANYSIVSWYDDPSTELRIFEVSEPLPTYAPLYSKNNEAGRDVVMIGRGTRRGDPVYLGGILRGWLWGAGDEVQRWGQNKINSASTNDLAGSFDQKGTAAEGQLSSGDSSGGLFMNDSGVWKLAGVCHSADGPVWTTPSGGEIVAALFDRRGFYTTNGQLISGSAPVPSRFFAARISARMAWIQSIVPSPDQAQMLSPKAGSTLPSSSVNFSWSAGSTPNYKIFVGNSLGASDIYNSGKLGVRSIAVNNIPTYGTTIYVRLFSLVKGKVKFIDYTYTAYH